MHRKPCSVGVEADLHVWEAMPHGGFGAFSMGDAAEINDEVRAFIRRVAG